MRRPIVFGALWVLAAVVAVAVAWAGVSVVGDQVTDERPAPLAAAEIEARLETEATSTTSTPSTASTGPGPEQPVGSTAPGPTSPPPTTAPAPTPTNGTPPPPPATAAPAAAETRTYNLVGGTAALRFSPQGVTIVFATPNAGFSVDTEPEHGNGVRVEFESPTHESRVDGWWDGGPVDRVREEAGD